jgi:membrane fusion protein, adhesin transport system
MSEYSDLTNDRLSRDPLAHPSRMMLFMTLALVALVIVAFCWAALAEVDEMTRGEGKVIPASRVQVVQNLEGGIVRRIATREGAMVREGDVILQIDSTGFGSSMEERREKMLGLQAVVTRMTAQADGIALVFPDKLAQQRPQLIHEQEQLYQHRVSEIAAALSGLDLQVAQRRQEIEEVKAKIASLARALEIAREEYALTEPLVQSGSAARIELIRLDARVNDTAGMLEASRLALPRIESALAEAQSRRKEKELNERADLRGQLSEARVQLAALEQTLKADIDRVDRTEVRAPVTGLVKTLHVTTLGQVVKPGVDIVEIIPTDDSLLIETRIRPQDIAFLRPGLGAVVRLTAYDYTLYGALNAKVEHIGADTISNERGETFYLVRARTDRATLEKDGRSLPIIPGMVANVDILTGKKTILAYLAKPITRLRSEALRER